MIVLGRLDGAGVVGSLFEWVGGLVTLFESVGFVGCSSESLSNCLFATSASNASIAARDSGVLVCRRRARAVTKWVFIILFFPLTWPFGANSVDSGAGEVPSGVSSTRRGIKGVLMSMAVVEDCPS